MKSFEHVTAGAVVRAAAAVAVNPPGNLLLPVVGTVFTSIFVDFDHFVITRVQRSDRANLRLMVTNPWADLLDQERVFEEFGAKFDRKHFLSHHPTGGAAIGALAFSGLDSLAALLAVMLYVHIVCDLLRDLGIT